MPKVRRSEPDDEFEEEARPSPKTRKKPRRSSASGVMRKFFTAVAILGGLAIVCTAIGYFLVKGGAFNPDKDLELEDRAAELLQGSLPEEVVKKLGVNPRREVDPEIVEWLKAGQADPTRYPLHESAKFAKSGEATNGPWYSPAGKQYTFVIHQKNPAGGRGAFMDATLSFEKDGQYKITIIPTQGKDLPEFHSVVLRDRSGNGIKLFLILAYKDGRLDTVLKGRFGPRAAQ
jgi:hypothetical protein